MSMHVINTYCRAALAVRRLYAVFKVECTFAVVCVDCLLLSSGAGKS